jgi:hypothetical protein
MQMVASFRIFFWFLCFPISRVIHTLFNWVVYYCYVFFVTQIHICMYNVWVLCDEYNSVFCSALLYVLHCCEVMLVICIVIFLDEWMIFSPTPAVRFGWRIAFLKTKPNWNHILTVSPPITSSIHLRFSVTQYTISLTHAVSHSLNFNFFFIPLMLSSLSRPHTHSLSLSQISITVSRYLTFSQ